MSFRLRIFVLVMMTALTAIGATAWLTLNLTQREVERSRKAQIRYQTEIINTIQTYGLRHGQWPGVDVVVADLAERTDLHIQLRTIEGQVLVDSDALQDRISGNVRADALTIDPRPTLDPAVLQAPKASVEGRPLKQLYGPVANSSRTMLAIRQAAQYRAALAVVRCQADKTKGDPALLTDKAPYLTATQMIRSSQCLRQATASVLSDIEWIKDVDRMFRLCRLKDLYTEDVNDRLCLETVFDNAVSASSAEKLQLYLGGRDETDLSRLGRPAMLGATGLLAVATLGTALIARRVSRPVGRLTLASRQLADGNLDVRVPTSGYGELAHLAESFNQMAEAVQCSEERQRRLIADVAHEMRTPLSNLRGYLEGLADGVIQPSQELFASLLEETLLQRRVLEDFQVLVLAEGDNLAYTKATFDLARLAVTSGTAHRAVAAEAGLALIVEAPHPVWVDGDADRLRQVVGNLLSNAIRYTDRGGHVMMRVWTDDGEAVLTVQNTGEGIAASDLPRVFERFWRADRARQRTTGGTGLGLTIAHRIVTDHRGRIEVASRPQIGTTFAVHLPSHETTSPRRYV